MKKNYILLFFIIISNIVTAQNSTFIYDLKYKMYPDSLSVENVKFYLDIKDDQSVFRSKMFRKSDSLRAKRGYPNGFEQEFNNKQLYVEKNRQTNSTLKYIFVPIVYSIFAIDIQDKLDWNIASEKLKIGEYDCQKAEVMYGGRKWTAWFTADINISDGPYVFKDLPGLIVKVSDEKEDFNFELTQIKNLEWKNLNISKYQKLISWEDFKKIQKNFFTNPYSSLKKGDILQETTPDKFVEVDLNQAAKDLLKIIKPKYHPLEINHKIEL
ncbi:GLPGLI family protein [Chryseobacterium balustinum]|uniref:GLPGLI family protein n=1 Tax=Chryseobacterium balustinum TaxID=246 RepID=UPI003CEFEA7C